MLSPAGGIHVCMCWEFCATSIPTAYVTSTGLDRHKGSGPSRDFSDPKYDINRKGGWGLDRRCHRDRPSHLYSAEVGADITLPPSLCFSVRIWSGLAENTCRCFTHHDDRESIRLSWVRYSLVRQCWTGWRLIPRTAPPAARHSEVTSLDVGVVASKGVCGILCWAQIGCSSHGFSRVKTCQSKAPWPEKLKCRPSPLQLQWYLPAKVVVCHSVSEILFKLHVIVQHFL